INSIRQLIDLSGHADRPCADADRIAKEQLASVRDRIAKLQKLEEELERIATCCTGETVGDCYVIRALSDHSLCGHEH
ncbi:MAG: MerR family transcriptional regulator, partial [Mesorhizobium sp.]